MAETMTPEQLEDLFGEPTEARSEDEVEELLDTSPIEPVLCGNLDCYELLVSLDANGWGTCALGHGGQPVGDDFTPPPPEWLERARSHVYLSGADFYGDICLWCKGSELDHYAVGACDHHFCSCDHLGFVHRAPDPEVVRYGVCRLSDPTGIECECDQMLCAFQGEHVVPGDVQVPVEAQAAKDEAKQGAFQGIKRDVMEGREITSRQVAFTGKGVVSWNNPQAEEWWAMARIGNLVSLTVTGELGAMGYIPEKDSGGYIVGLIHQRKVKIEGLYWRPPETPTEGLPLFEHGLQARVDHLDAACGHYLEVLAALAPEVWADEHAAWLRRNGIRTGAAEFGEEADGPPAEAPPGGDTPADDAPAGG